MNRHIITGNLTRDPEFKTTTSGKSRCAFTVACSRRFKNADGVYDADFINCVAWGGTAEFISKYFSKGQAIEVEGWVRTDRYVDDEGVTRWSNSTIVDYVGFNGPKRNKTSGKHKEPTVDFSELEGADLPDYNEEDLPF